jgi:hypothetical protein
MTPGTRQLPDDAGDDIEPTSSSGRPLPWQAGRRTSADLVPGAKDHRQRLGGIAAVIEAGTFVFGFALYATMLSDYTTGDPTPAESVAFVTDHQVELYLWNLVIFIVFGIVLVPLTLALGERIAVRNTALAATATAFGLIWATLVVAAGMIANLGISTIADLDKADPQAATAVWSSLDTVQNGLGGGYEVVGGIWLLLISAAAMNSAVLPRGLGVLGNITGGAGVLTLVPGLEDAGAIFGIGLIAWFMWTALVLLRSPVPSPDPSQQPALSTTR